MAEYSKVAAAPVKVVMIEYHHVHTDASNFKSVVQSLTGKHSSAVHTSGETRKRRRLDDTVMIRSQFEERTESCRIATTSFLHSESFKDLDRLLKLDLPSVEDLTWIWAD